MAPYVPCNYHFHVVAKLEHLIAIVPQSRSPPQVVIVQHVYCNWVFVKILAPIDAPFAHIVGIDHSTNTLFSQLVGRLKLL
jgi:hypothetical protein